MNMPIKIIRKIIKQELQVFYSEIKANIRYANECTNYIAEYGYQLTLEKLESCDDYESLDDFIGEWYQMHLQEWIDSIPE